MNLKTIALTAALIFSFSCNTPDDKPFKPHFIDQNRILSVKIDPPVVKPGDKISLNMLIGGNNFMQEFDYPISWEISNITLSASYDAHRKVGAYLDVPDFNEADGEQNDSDLLLRGDLSEMLPSEDIEFYKTSGYVDVLVKVSYETLSAFKSFRIANPTTFDNMECSNPLILKLNYKTDKTNEGSISYGELLHFDKSNIPAEIELSSLIDSTGNRAFIQPSYKWRFSLEKDTQKELIISDKSEISTNTINVQPSNGFYSVYLTVNDTKDGCNGSDFFYFYLSAGAAEVSDEDSLL